MSVKETRIGGTREETWEDMARLYNEKNEKDEKMKMTKMSSSTRSASSS